MAHDSTFVAALTEQAKAFISPVGQIADFHTVPNGWLRCDGSTYNISEYPALFAAVGTKYGGDGKTTFAVPNLHRKFREGTTTDSEVGTSVSAGLPNITGEGDWVFGGYASTGKFTGSMYHVSLPNNPGATGGNDYYNGKPGIGIDASRSSSIYGNASTVQPSSLRMIPCVKA